MRAVHAWCLLASLAAHAGPLLLLVDWQEERGSAVTGVGAIEVSLLPAGAAPGSVARVDLPGAVPVAAMSEGRVAKAREPAEAWAPDAVTAVGPAEAAMGAPPESTRTVTSEPPPEVAPAIAPPPPEAIEPVIIPVPAAKPPAPPMARAPARKPPPQVASAAPPGDAPGAAGRTVLGQADDRSADRGRADGGEPAAAAEYLATLQAWLERHKKYPRRARLRRQEGTALLRFVMDRRGQVLSYRIEEGSGHGALDDAAVAMIERAQPLPEIPPAIRDARLELVVPVRFQLR